MNNNPSITDMLLLVSVVEAGSFTGAADRLGKTKSAISQGISRLEADLGVKLLHRTTRKLSLTEEGIRFHHHCLTITNLKETAIGEAQANRQEPIGNLVLTAPSAVTSTLISPVLQRYLKQYPEMAVTLHSSDRRMDLVEDRIDLAIRVGEPAEQTARQRLLGHMRDLYCAAPGYIDQMGGKPSHMMELADWDHVASDWQGAQTFLEEDSGRRRLVQPRIRCTSLADCLQFVRQGFGVGRLPDFAIRQDLETGRLSLLQQVEDSPQVGIYALHIYDQHPPLRVVKFLEMLKQELRV